MSGTANGYALDFIAMGSAGDDLRKYLIIPSASLDTSHSLSSNPELPYTTTKPRSSISSFDTIVEYDSITTRGSTGKAEESNMEIDTPTQLSMFNSAHTEQEPMARAAPPSGILSMDDFMKQNQDEHQAQREARYATTVPPAKKAKSSENATPLTPVAVGARSSKHTILLHEKYQALGIQQPLFTYEGSSSSSWAARVSFPGLEDVEELQGLSGDKGFNSKQEAKEALSEKAFAVLEEMERQGRVKKAEKNRKKSVGGQLEQQSLVEKEPVENYVGKLLGRYTLFVCSIYHMSFRSMISRKSPVQTNHPNQNTNAQSLAPSQPTPTTNPAPSLPAS